jgi:putative ABC transport system permease protein
MGRVLLVCRLAARDLRRRPAEAALLLVAITAATATLTLGLGLRGATSKSYETTRAATAGPDVVASVASPSDRGVPPDLAGLKALANAPGAVGHSGPYPVVWTRLRAHGHTLEARVEARDTAPAPIDRPKLTQGSWLDGGGVVVEAAFADALGVGAGDPSSASPSLPRRRRIRSCPALPSACPPARSGSAGRTPGGSPRRRHPSPTS